MSATACLTLQQFLLDELTEAQRRQKALKKSSEPEHVHQLRICLRKLRTAFTLAKPILKTRYRRRWQKRLRKAAKQLDMARDLDVLLLSVSQQPSPDIAVHKHLQQQQNTSYKALRKKLHRPPFSQWRKLKKQLKQQGWIQQRCRNPNLSLNQFASQQLETIYQKIEQTYGRLDMLDDDALHRLRIHCKQLRYAYEFVGPSLKSQSSSHFLDSLRELQDRLGALHDAKVQQSLLASCPTSPPAATMPALPEEARTELAAELGRFLGLSKPWSTFGSQ